MDSLTKVGFYFFITNYMKHPIPRLHTHEEVSPKVRSDSSVSQAQASAQLHETEPRHRAPIPPSSRTFPYFPSTLPPLQREGGPPSIWRRNQTNKGAPPKLYCSTRKAILLYLRSYIGSTPEQYRCAHRTNKQDKHPYSGRTPPPCLPAFPAHRLQSTSTARPCHNLREESFISRARTIIYKGGA